MGDNTGHWLKAYVDHEDRRLHKKIDENTAELEAALAVEEQERKAADSTLQAGLNKEKSDRIDADAAVRRELQTEAAERKAEDNKLNIALNAETAARTSADNVLREDLTEEISERTSADEALYNFTNGVSQRLQKEIEDRTELLTQMGEEHEEFRAEFEELRGTDNELTEALRAVAQERDAADAQLQAAIDAEATARTNADTALQTALDTHKNDKTNPHGVTKAQLEMENVENTADLDKPVSTATQAAINAEKSARENADTALQTSIETEAAARETADEGLQEAIETETTARTAADTTLETAIAQKADTSVVLTKTNTEVFTPSGNYQPATKKYVDDSVSAAGGGDMLKSVYDTNNNGKVDDSDKLGGQAASYYATHDEMNEMWETIDRKFSAAFPGGGTGTEDDPYVILSREDLERVRDNLSAHYIVQGAIYLNTPWEPIGSETAPFMGVFDGNGYTIRNLTVTQGKDASGYAGLFAVNEGTIQNVRLENVNVSIAEGAAPQVGAVAGMNNTAGVISDTSVVSGNIAITGTSSGNVGGISGTNYGQIKNSYNKAKILAAKGTAAGVAAYNRGTAVVKNVYSAAEISAPEVAGVVYWNMNTATLENSYNLFPVCAVQTVSSTSSVINSETKTMSELKQQETFTGWDFENTWEIMLGQFPTLRIAKGTDPNVNNLGLPDGSKEHPYKITFVEEFKNIPKDLSGNYILTGDINLTDVEWTPIGTRTEPFTGSLHGNGHAITYFSLNSGIEDDDGNTYAGLFAFNNGTLFDVDLVVDVIDVTGTNTYAGAVAAVNMENGVLEQVAVRSKTASVPIKSGNCAGGLTAVNNGTIKNCYTRVRLESVSAGGITGINGGNIDYTYASERMTTTETAGGIAGENTGMVSNSYACNANTSATEIVGTGTAAVSSEMKTSSNLKRQRTYVGWDFENVWEIVSEALTLPVLIRASYATTEEQLAALTEEVSALNSEISGLNSTVDLLTAAVLEG